MNTLFTLVVLFTILLMLIAELIYSRRKGIPLYSKKDTLNNIKVGMVSLTVNMASKLIFLFALKLIYTFRMTDIENSLFNCLLCLLAADFSYYWYHRACHGINWFWLTHCVHHSSEHLNISTSFRQSMMTHLSGHFIFWLWIPLLGFAPETIMLCHLFIYSMQGHLHTELIKKLPPFVEYIFNTPSHHRVHHGSNPDYIDRNHGGLLIIWDRIFSTFTAEKEKPVYGLSDKPQLNTTAEIMFHEWNRFFINLRQSESLRESWYYIFGKPGWNKSESHKKNKRIMHFLYRYFNCLTKNFRINTAGLIILCFTASTTTACTAEITGDTVKPQTADSSRTFVLICKSKKKKDKIYFFSEGKKIILIDTSGKKYKGRLHLINRQYVQTCKNKKRSDTLSISGISKIKIKKPGRKILSAFVFTASLPLKFISYEQFTYRSNFLGDYPPLFFLLNALAVDACGILLLRGKTLRSDDYEFIILSD